MFLFNPYADIRGNLQVYQNTIFWTKLHGRNSMDEIQKAMDEIMEKNAEVTLKNTKEVGVAGIIDKRAKRQSSESKLNSQNVSFK